MSSEYWPDSEKPLHERAEFFPVTHFSLVQTAVAEGHSSMFMLYLNLMILSGYRYLQR